VNLLLEGSRRQALLCQGRTARHGLAWDRRDADPE
jgi:hypothetical protein